MKNETELLFFFLVGSYFFIRLGAGKQKQTKQQQQQQLQQQNKNNNKAIITVGPTSFNFWKLFPCVNVGYSILYLASKTKTAL